MAAKFELRKLRTGFRFQLKAPNGKYLLTSEIYAEKPLALNALSSLRIQAAKELHYEIRPVSKSHLQFVLLAKDNSVLAQSETYASLKGCRNGISSSISNAPSARLIDFTAS